MNLPNCLDNAFKSERTQDVGLLYDLRILYDKNSSEVEIWLRDPRQDINRKSIQTLKLYIDSLKTQKSIPHHDNGFPENNTVIHNKPDLVNENESDYKGNLAPVKRAIDEPTAEKSIETSTATSEIQKSESPTTYTRDDHKNEALVETPDSSKSIEYLDKNESVVMMNIIVTSSVFLGTGRIVLYKEPLIEENCFVQLDNGDIVDVTVKDLDILKVEPIKG